MLKELLTAPKVIRSIQRGAGKLSATTKEFTVNLSEVDVSKCYVDVHVGYYNMSPYIKDFQSTSLTIACSAGSGSGDVDWQVVEFC